jgi:hypothetical protein
MRGLQWIVLSCAWITFSCASTDAACLNGTEGCACWANATCDEGLACRSKLCVKLERLDRAVGDKASPQKAGSAAPAPGPAGSSAPACDGPGAVCRADADCCGARCIQSICSDQCARGDDCLTGCCIELTTGESACAAIQLCSPPPNSGTRPIPPPAHGTLVPITTCSTLALIADDDQFLGNASSNRYATDGICNEFSQYGSEFGSHSIHNEFGTYGGEFSNLSAYNKFTNTPPHLRCENGSELNPVTKNQFLAGVIDPDVLCETLASNGY